MLDFFHGETIDKINRAAISRVISVAVSGDKVFLRHYAMVFVESSTTVFF